MSAKGWTFRYRWRLVRIIDADTVSAGIDCGLRVTVVMPLRLAGCNAAEHDTPEGKAATAYVEQWLKDHADKDGYLAAITKPYPDDPHGRWLAEIQSLDGLHDLTDDLIAAGHALPYDGRGPKPVPAEEAS